MSKQENKFILDGQLDLSYLNHLEERPAPFVQGDSSIWIDPHISRQLLAVHLDPTTDQASRKPETIEASVAWMVGEMGLGPGDHVLDLGCGPGLYAHRLVNLGLKVTGVDFSSGSIEYARKSADEFGLTITYRYQDYLTLEDDSLYDAVLLIFGDFCVLNPDQRKKLLSSIHRALKPGGHFVLDVSTRKHRELNGARTNWQVSQGGFWQPGPHLVLEKGFDYPDDDMYCDQYVVIDEDGGITVYRNWFQDYDHERIRGELEEGGFEVQGVWDDLRGTTYSGEGEWIGVIVKKH